MNSPHPAPQPPRASPRRRIFLWFVGLMGLCGLVIAVAVVNVMTLTRDAATLRDEMLDAVDHDVRTKIQVSVGPTMLATVRSVLALIPDVDAEARLAMSSVRHASVGVYELSAAPSATARATILESADKAMNRRGWTRAVAVNDGDDLVLVYLRENARSGETQRLCMAVCSDHELVVVAGTVDAAPLAKLMAQRGGFAAR